MLTLAASMWVSHPGCALLGLPCPPVFVFPAHVVKVSRARPVTLAQKPQDSSLPGSALSGPLQEDLATEGTLES